MKCLKQLWKISLLCSFSIFHAYSQPTTFHNTLTCLYKSKLYCGLHLLKSLFCTIVCYLYCLLYYFNTSVKSLQNFMKIKTNIITYLHLHFIYISLKILFLSVVQCTYMSIIFPIWVNLDLKICWRKCFNFLHVWPVPSLSLSDSVPGTCLRTDRQIDWKISVECCRHVSTSQSTGVSLMN